MVPDKSSFRRCSAARERLGFARRVGLARLRPNATNAAARRSALAIHMPTNGEDDPCRPGTPGNQADVVRTEHRDTGADHERHTAAREAKSDRRGRQRQDNTCRGESELLLDLDSYATARARASAPVFVRAFRAASTSSPMVIVRSLGSRLTPASTVAEPRIRARQDLSVRHERQQGDAGGSAEHGGD
jgi:hypothetical protein